MRWMMRTSEDGVDGGVLHFGEPEAVQASAKQSKLPRKKRPGHHRYRRSRPLPPSLEPDIVGWLNCLSITEV